MSTGPGRPPTTVEGEVRAVSRQLRRPQGVLLVVDRVTVMRALLAQAERAASVGVVDRQALVKLAAHSIAWAEEREGE